MSRDVGDEAYVIPNGDSTRRKSKIEISFETPIHTAHLNSVVIEVGDEKF